MWVRCRPGCGINRKLLNRTIHGARRLSHFRVIEHEVPAQHTRIWPRGTEVGLENALKLAVKQYIPLGKTEYEAGEVTFIAAHANGFPKVSALQSTFQHCSETLQSKTCCRNFTSLSLMSFTKS